ncbi:MAG: hypothetical protein KGZ68_04880 [Dechloromonas sp.]|nr:hypothetical protein [Dechloromonas sp.]
MTQHQAAYADAPKRSSTLSVPALRRRAAEHPMALFSVVATVAVLSVSAPWQAASGILAPAAAAPRSEPVVPSKPARSEIDLACEGQVWGRETTNCLLAIAKDGGKDLPARIRTISGA